MSTSPGLWLLRHYTGASLRSQPWRALIQCAAIATGVALGYAISLINASALAEFSAAERTLSGDADSALVGGAQGFDEAWYARIASDPSVAVAAPQLQVDATLADGATRSAGLTRGRSLRILGIDALRSALLAPELVGHPAGAGNPLTGLLSEGLFLSPAALAQLQVHVGDTLELVVGDRIVRLPISGTLPQARAALAVMDLGYAQWRLGRVGRLSRIDIKYLPGTDIDAVERAWPVATGLPMPAGRSAALNPGLHLEHGAVAVEREQGLSRAYRVNLNVLAMVALFTGGFLVYSLQAQAVVARRAQLALLRMLGLTRAGVSTLLVREALVLGTLGALLGLAAGAALAGVALHTLGGDLGGGYFAGSQPHLVLDLPGALLFFALGLAAAIAGAWLPAREAAAQAPAPALKAGVDATPGAQASGATGALLALAVALLLLLAPPLHGIPVGAYAAIALLLVACIGLQPVLAPWLFTRLARTLAASPRLGRHAPAWLAATRLARLPRFAAVGAAGIVASFALMVAMASMVGSFRTSFDVWLGQVLAADLYVRAAPAGSTGRLSGQDQQRIAGDPDVLKVQFSHIESFTLDPARAPITLIARVIDPANPARQLPLVGASAVVAVPALPVWVSEAVVDLYGARVGAPLPPALASALLALRGSAAIAPAGTAPALVVAGVWRDYARQGGSLVMGLDDYAALCGDTSRSDAAVWLRPGASTAGVAQRLLATLQAPALQVVAQGDIRALSLRLFDRSFQVTYLLEWAAIVIGLIGLATTFSAQAIARTREFGMLRHLGVTRRQILQLLAAEATLVTLLAAALGLVAGLAIAAILVHVVNPQSFHWTMELRIPWGLLAGLSLTLLLAAALTSTLAGRRALSVDAVRAVRDDW